MTWGGHIFFKQFVCKWIDDGRNKRRICFFSWSSFSCYFTTFYFTKKVKTVLSHSKIILVKSIKCLFRLSNALLGFVSLSFWAIRGWVNMQKSSKQKTSLFYPLNLFVHKIASYPFNQYFMNELFELWWNETKIEHKTLKQV